MCKKGFGQKVPYTSHMRSHEGLKYRCEYCGKSFTRQMKLKYHMSEHTGNYRFKCDHCSKGLILCHSMRNMRLCTKQRNM